MQFQWNHRIHERWGNERLFFWRLGFAPAYDRDAIVLGLERVMEKHGIGSYGYYQLAGAYDMILRIWLPNSVTQEDFEKTMADELLPVDLRMYDVFIVSKIIMHHVWGRENHPLEPDETTLSQPFKDEVIDQINRRALSNDALSNHMAKHVIAPFTPEPGIKFFIVIPSAGFPDARTATDLKRNLRKILLEADRIKEPSIYFGNGFGQFLIAGRVDYADFFYIHERLTERINGLGIGSMLRIRTYTHLTSKEQLLGFQESLPHVQQPSPFVQQPEPIPPPVSGEWSVEALLKHGESETVEFKGSAFVDINRWIATDELVPSDKVTNEGVLLTMVGFLNSKGGTLVIGVLEAEKFPEKILKTKLSELRRQDEYLCYGVEHDFGGKNWDWFQLRLLDIMDKRISPVATPFITVQKWNFLGKTLCVLSVRPVDRLWFYLKDDPSFYVRRGASTVALAGPDADHYKLTNPRPPR